MTKMMSSGVPLIPTPLDELAAILASIPHFPPTTRQVDAPYTLSTAIAEVEAWLHGSLTDRETRTDHASLVTDVSDALSQRGRHVKSRTPTSDTLLIELQRLAPKKGQRRNPAQALVSLDSLTNELTEPDTAVAAFDDLLEAVEDAATSRRSVEDRLAVLACALNLARRPIAQVCRRLSDIAQDQQYEIDLTRRDLDGVKPRPLEQIDATAGLTAEQRLNLSRRYLLLSAPPAHHIVWLSYQNARVSSYWREKVGPVEFFDGPTLVTAINDSEMSATPLPEELTQLSEEPERSGELWPPTQDVALWAAARIDLGVGNFADPVRAAKDLADAVVQVATFNRGESTWQPLEGHVHFQDGRQGSSEGFHPAWPADDLRAQSDATADEFEKLADLIGSHLPITNVSLRRLVVHMTDLNASMRLQHPSLILGDIRAIEFVARQCGSPDWLAMMIGKTATSHAWNRAVNEIYFAVRQARSDFTLILHEQDDQDLLEDQPWDLSASAAYDLIPQLLQRGPTYHRAMRRLRDLSRHTASRESVSEWINQLKLDYKRSLERAERFRNALTHGDAATHEVAETISILINMKARNVIRLALESVIAAKPISDSLTTWRQEFRAWEKAISTAGTARDALFAEHKSAEAG